MISLRQLASLSFVFGLAAAVTACNGTASPTSPSALATSSAAALSSHRGSDSPGSDDPSGASNGESGSIRIRCEFRSGRRSKISVDGNNLPSGTYTARVQSGANVATAPARATIGDEVEFDFDSDRDDIEAGATAIARNFLASGSVSGQLVNAGGDVVASDTTACRVR